MQAWPSLAKIQLQCRFSARYLVKIFNQISCALYGARYMNLVSASEGVLCSNLELLSKSINY